MLGFYAAHKHIGKQESELPQELPANAELMRKVASTVLTPPERVQSKVPQGWANVQISGSQPGAGDS